MCSERRNFYDCSIPKGDNAAATSGIFFCLRGHIDSKKITKGNSLFGLTTFLTSLFYHLFARRNVHLLAMTAKMHFPV